MNPVEDVKINLNQNLWGLIIGFVSLGASEYFELCTLFWFSIVVAVIMTLSIGATTFVYTTSYIKNKKS